MNTDVLMTTLELAVPLRIAELEAMRDSLRAATLEAWRVQAADDIAHRGDILQFRGGKRGETAKVFNNLACGLAVLAHAPGGVLFHGVHWCLEHPGGIHATSITELGCSRGWAQPEPPPTRTPVTLAAPDIL